MKKHLVVAGLATAVGVTGLTGIGIANAATTTASSTNPMSSLVDALATKFNLNKSDVQQVFDEQRSKMDEQREAEVSADVAQLVKDGKITQDQADKINAKRVELKKERDTAMSAGMNKTREQMRSDMQAKRTELEQWAKDNGIDASYLRYVFGGHGHGGPGGPRDEQ